MRQHLQVILAALLVLVAGYVGYKFLFVGIERTTLTVVIADGEVARITQGGATEDATAGMILTPRDRLQVGEGRAVLSIDDQSRLTLDAASTIEVLEVDATGVRVELEDGKVQARIRPDSPMLSVFSRGRGVASNDADFTIGVDSEGALAVKTENGVVEVQGIDGINQVEAGQQMNAMPSQNAVVGSVPASLLLEVAWPESGRIREAALTIEGRTDPYAEIRLGSGDDGSTVRAGSDGHFQVSLPLKEGQNPLQVEARDALGNVQTADAEVVRDSTAPRVSSEVVWER